MEGRSHTGAPFLFGRKLIIGPDQSHQSDGLLYGQLDDGDDSMKVSSSIIKR